MPTKHITMVKTIFFQNLIIFGTPCELPKYHFRLNFLKWFLQTDLYWSIFIYSITLCHCFTFCLKMIRPLAILLTYTCYIHKVKQSDCAKTDPWGGKALTGRLYELAYFLYTYTVVLVFIMFCAFNDTRPPLHCTLTRYYLQFG